MDTPESIKIIKNFINKEDIATFINYIDTNLSKFYVDPRSKEGKRYAYKFGRDAVHPDSRWTMDELWEVRNLVDTYSDKVCSATKDQFSNTDELFLSSFWMAKQDPGAVVTYHKDTDQDNNLQFKYSAVLYLNSMPEYTGKLRFPELFFQYCPEEGDLIVFPSHGDEFTHGVDWIARERYSLAFWMTEDKGFMLQ